MDNGDPKPLLFSMTRLFRFLPDKQKPGVFENLREKASVNGIHSKAARPWLGPVT
jgi:hypothetical protein